MSAEPFAAFRFDGRSAAAAPVTVTVEAGRIVVAEAECGTAIESHPLALVQVSEPLERAPRLVSLPGGATLEVPDPGQRLEAALLAEGRQPGLVARMQRRAGAAAASLLLLVASAAAAYAYGLPALTHWAAFALPDGIERRLGEGVLATLDRHRLEPSRLPEDLRARIASRLAAAAGAAGSDAAWRLEFRRGGDGLLGVNAFALPGGVIVLLDGVVELAGADEDMVLGVLGHELGHVEHKHVTRQILQGLGVGAIASLLWGDFSGVAGGVPVVLALLENSREFEREADGRAVSVLAAAGLPPDPLARFFTTLQERMKDEGLDDLPAFLSSHPPTEERLQRLRSGGEPAAEPAALPSRAAAVR